MTFDYHLLRSWLFVPGDSERKMERSWTTDSDALIMDLEDAVAAPRKELARSMVRGAIDNATRGNKAVAIRVNALDTGLTDVDLEQTIACRPNAYVLPKVLASTDVISVSSRIRRLEKRHGFEEGSIGLIPIVTEHPRAVMRLDDLCKADPRTVAVIWGTEDLSAAIGARRVKDEHGAMLDVYRVVRAMALLAASAAGIAVIDTPVVELEAIETLRRESRDAADMGFTGKLAIHPLQAAPINEAFLPTSEELEYAVALLEENISGANGSGTFRFRGKMIDMPHLRMAQRLVDLSRAHAQAEIRSGPGK